MYDITGFFTSVTTTIFLLIALAAASVLGTVVPQETDLREIAEGSSPLVVRLIAILDLNEVYTSWWFLLLLALLAANLIGCLIQRLPSIVADWKGSRPRASFRIDDESSDPPGKVEATLTEAIRDVMGSSPRKRTDGDRAILAWNRQRFHLLGFPFIHIAIVVILFGALLGMLFGYKGRVSIPEGEAADTFIVRPTGEVRPFPFRLVVDKFTLDRYPDGRPKEFRSDVRLLDGDTVLYEGPILVNHPVTRHGISLYQSDYRARGVQAVDLLLRDDRGREQVFSAEPMTEPTLPDTLIKIRLLSLDPGTTKKGAGVKMKVISNDGTERVVSVFENDEMPAEIGPWEVRYKGYDTLYATGLQVGYDPGSRVVWTGCILLIVGFMLTLFTNFRRVTAEIWPADGVTKIKVTGGSKRLRKELRQSIEDSVRGALSETNKMQRTSNRDDRSDSMNRS